MDAPHLIYFSDPMCSWCWGFSPVVEAIQGAFGDALPIRLVMGGLRPGTETPMTDEAWAQMRGYWGTVHQAAGVPFHDQPVPPREGFVYDTDPAARAVVLMRIAHPGRELAYLARLQRAFYAENRDITSRDVQADLAAELGADRARFRDALDQEALGPETWRDYALSQRAGVTGFPTLVAGPSAEGTYGVVTRGFAPAAQVLAVLSGWLGTAEPQGTA